VLQAAQNGGIINTGDAGLKKLGFGNVHVPIASAKLRRIKEAFEKSGGEMLSSPELDEYLDMREADALTLNEKLVIFRHARPPTASEVFEELIHTAQFRSGRVSTGNAAMLEIEAKEKLIKNQVAYGIPEHENEQTKAQLEKLRHMMFWDRRE